VASEPTWPSEPSPEEADKLVLQAKLDYLKELAKSEQAEELERVKQEQEADTASLQAMEDAANASVAAFHNAVLEVSKSAIDRARTGAETVQKAAGAIGGLYTGLLAAAFSVAERPLPPRGLVPAILLGWAIAWSTAYLAYLSNAKPVRKPQPTSDFETGAMRRSIAFIRWTRSGAMNRKYALHVSVVALALGVALLPAPFIDFDPAADEPAAAPVAAEWPSAPTGPDPKLNKVLYQAQVEEVAGLRAAKEPVAGDGDDSTWWLICGGCLAITLLIPALVAWGRKDEGDEDPSDDDIPAPAEAIPAPAPAPPADTRHS
jgi:hypothetical protein